MKYSRSVNIGIAIQLLLFVVCTCIIFSIYRLIQSTPSAAAALAAATGTAAATTTTTTTTEQQQQQQQQQRNDWKV